MRTQGEFYLLALHALVRALAGVLPEALAEAQEVEAGLERPAGDEGSSSTTWTPGRSSRGSRWSLLATPDPEGAAQADRLAGARRLVLAGGTLQERQLLDASGSQGKSEKEPRTPED